VSDFQKCIDELNLDLQRGHEWAAANGLNLNLIKSQVIVINRCRVDIPPPTQLIGFVPAHRSDESFLCCTWVPGVECVA
jgi:hypothetical protein